MVLTAAERRRLLTRLGVQINNRINQMIPPGNRETEIISMVTQQFLPDANRLVPGISYIEFEEVVLSIYRNNITIRKMPIILNDDEKDFLRRKLSQKINIRIDELIELGLDPSNEVQREELAGIIAQEFYSEARWLIKGERGPRSEEIEYPDYRKFAEQLVYDILVDRGLILSRPIKRIATYPGRKWREPELGKVKRTSKFWQKGEEIEKLAGERKVKIEERGRKRLETLKDEQARWKTEGENKLRRENVPEYKWGEIRAIVRNETDEDASKVVASCWGQDQQMDRIPKRSAFSFVFSVSAPSTQSVTVRSSSHDVEPKVNYVELTKEKSTGLANFQLKKREKRGGAAEAIKKRRTELIKGRRQYFSGVVGSIILMVIGFVVSALIGQPWFVVAFLFFAISWGIPPSESGLDIAAKMEEIKKRYEKLIAVAEEAGESEEHINSLYKRMGERLKAEKMIGDLKFGKLFKPYYGKAFLRELSKGLGFLFLMVAFVFSSIPMAPVIGIVIGFAGYFTLGGSDYQKGIKKEEEKAE